MVPPIGIMFLSVHSARSSGFNVAGRIPCRLLAALCEVADVVDEAPLRVVDGLSGFASLL